MSEQWSDDRALAVYRRVFPGDQVWPGADPRSAAIAEEMRMVKAAPTAEAACAVIASLSGGRRPSAWSDS